MTKVTRCGPLIIRSVTRIIKIQIIIKNDNLKRVRALSRGIMTTVDEGMRTLSNSRRPQILNSLREEEYFRPVPGDGIGRHPAIRLHHVHLPLLEANSLFEWNRTAGTVRKGEEVEDVRPVLTALDTRSDALPDDSFPNESQSC